MDTMNSIHADEHRRELRRRAGANGSAPRTQVRRWVQLKHVFGSGEERWGTAARQRGAAPVAARRDPACATC